MARKVDEKNCRCSFCGKTQNQVRKLLAGPNDVFICDECIDLCADIMDEELEDDVEDEPLEDDVDLHLLRQAVRELPDREREIVLMRYGLEGYQELTQKEVAYKLGISQSYISRLEKRIMLRLRNEILRQTSCV